MSKVVVLCNKNDLIEEAREISRVFDIPYCSMNKKKSRYGLMLTNNRLELKDFFDEKSKSIAVNFLSAAEQYRMNFGGGRNQMIAKAVGVNKYENISVLDVTAGLGSDAFTLACLGCNVTLIERVPAIAALLYDGLRRARQADWFSQLKMNFMYQSSLSYMMKIDRGLFDVIYIDPMFPEKKKSALPKKEMLVLRDLAGADSDAGALLTLALGRATKRVVVKRSKSAPFLVGQKPDFQYGGASTRFDVYDCHSRG